MATPSTDFENKVKDILEKAGLKLPEDFRIVYTKKIEISRAEGISVRDVLPYKLPECEGEKIIEGAKVPSDKTYHIDYFIQDEKIMPVRKLIQHLLEKQGASETMMYKLAIESPSTVLNPKEILMQLKELAKGDPELANQWMPLIHYFNPREQFMFRFIWGVHKTLKQVQIQYNRLVMQWKAELKQHTEIEDDTICAGYEALVDRHEKEATDDYETIRTFLDEQEAKVHMISELVKEMKKEEPYAGILKGIRREKERMPRTVYLRPSRASKRTELY